MSWIGRKLAYAGDREIWDGLSGGDDTGARKPLLTPFSPICVIELNRQGIESDRRIGVCREYTAVSDRDSCAGLVNF